MTDSSSALVADIGGTNARFALIEGDAVVETRILRCADHSSLTEAAEAYIKLVGRENNRPARGAFDVAGPVTGDEIAFTNLVWKFSIEKTRRALGFDSLRVVNDFAAAALSIPRLGGGDRVKIGEGEPVQGGVIGVLGAGSGLGVGGLVSTPAGYAVLPGEGGHVTMAAAENREAEVLAVLRGMYGHVSAERVLSGPGIVNLFTALRKLAGLPAPDVVPSDVTKAALEGTDPVAVEAVTMFSRMLGTVAGNLALTLGAHGGIYIAGGVVPRLGDFFANAGFRAAFEEKGPMSKFLKPIPTYVVTHPLPAFLGLMSVLEE